jgi:hypothetical protein
VVTWNGRRSSGAKVAPGKVTWVVLASNADGPARAGNGSKHPVHATITVTR